MSREMTRREFCGKAATVVAATVLVSPLALLAKPLTEEDKSEMKKKRMLGQFFTERESWLQPQVDAFIRATGDTIAYDPFAGTGCLLSLARKRIDTIKDIRGLDIDTTLGWDVNDSLLNIPHVDGAVIITNPPYISNYSAARKKIGDGLQKYFDTTSYDDVYLLALDKMLEAQKNVVAIVPETFINSPYRQKRKLHSVTILEKNPFLDTDTPVVIVCFDSVDKEFDEIKIYKDSTYISTLQEVEDARLIPDNSVTMRFNDINGWLGVRCVDTTNPDDMIRFAYKDDIDYNWDKGIKVSSRLLTLISIDVPLDSRTAFIAECNRILAHIREVSHDVILSPFKGNMKNGVRRRRLDFMTCRAIVERAYKKTLGGNNKDSQGYLPGGDEAKECVA